MYDSVYDTSGFGSMILPGQVPGPVAPTREVVPATAGFMPGWNVALPRFFNDLAQPLDPRTIELMFRDPAVTSSFNTHRINILEGGLQLTSPIRQPPWAHSVDAPSPPTSSLVDTADPAPDTGRTLTADQSLAKEVHEFCERSWARMKGKTQFMFELLEALAVGCKMAEMTFAVPEEGIDAGKYVFDRISVKPNWAWRFVVNTSKQVQGFLSYDSQGGYEVYSPEKFLWLSWMPRDSDPRGTSLFEAARTAWNLKMQAWPAHYQHLRRFGSPGLDLMLPPDAANQRYASINADGTFKNDGTTMDAIAYYSIVLALWQGGGFMLRPAMSEFKVIEPVNPGDAFAMAIDLYDRQITRALEYQTRAAMEAKHGSKADSGTAENIKDVITGFGRDWLSDCLYKAFKLLVTLNWNADVAARMTSIPSFGSAPKHERPALWMAYAGMGGKLGESQLVPFCEEVGLPPPDLAADRQSGIDAMRQQFSMQAEFAPKPAPADTTGANTGKPASQPKPSKTAP